MTVGLISLGAAARRLTSLVLAVSCALPMALPVAAQDPATPQQPTQQPQQQPAQQPTPTVPQSQPAAQDIPNPSLSRPIGERTVGLDPGKVVRWTMRDAILAALDKNVDIELERENVRLAQWDVIAAQGVYDPLTSSFVGYNSNTSANTRQFSGTDATTTTSNTISYNFGWQQLIQKTGGSYQANFNNQRNTNNFGVLSPQYNPQLNFSITQPLFKGYKIDQNRRQIRIFKKRLDLSDAQFRRRAIEIISTVQQAYWDLALAIQNEKVARDSVTLAETQLRNNQRQVEVGTLAPIDVTNAAALLESSRTDVFRVMNQVAQAENALKALTVDGPNDDLWGARIEPVEKFEVQPLVMPLNDALKLAMENRPEIKQFALQRDINQVDVDFYRNQAKPQIDLVGTYATNGVGGTSLRPDNTTCSDPFTVNNQKVCAFPVVNQVGNDFVLGVQQVPFTSVPGTADNFVGGYGTSLRNLFKNSFRTWSVGVNFSLPLRNRVAKANLARAREVDKQIDLQTRRQLQDIEVEVRNAIQAIETTKLRIESSHAARIYAEQQLEGENKKFQAGLSSTFLVLQRQTDLSQARFTELQALADYNKSVATLQRVISTTLTSNNIEVKSDAPQPTK